MQGSNVMITVQSEGLCPSGEGLQLFNVLLMTWMLGQSALLANLQVIWNWARVVYSALSRDHWRRITLFSATFWKVIKKSKKNCAGTGQTTRHQVGIFDYIKEKSPTFTLKMVRYWREFAQRVCRLSVILDIQNQTKSSGQPDVAILPPSVGDWSMGLPEVPFSRSYFVIL